MGGLDAKQRATYVCKEPHPAPSPGQTPVIALFPKHVVDSGQRRFESSQGYVKQIVGDVVATLVLCGVLLIMISAAGLIIR